MKIILASKSPRRKELLSQVGYTYECVVSEKEENTDAVQPSDVVKELSQQKAEDVCAKIEKEGQMEEDCPGYRSRYHRGKGFGNIRKTEGYRGCKENAVRIARQGA